MKYEIWQIVDPQDLLVINSLGEEFSESTEVLGSNFDSVGFYNVWSTLIDVGNGFIAIALADNGAKAGLIGGFISPSPINGELEAIETFWFVSKGYRNSSIAKDLFQSFWDWADGNGAKRLMMSALPDQSKNVEKSYISRGFKVVSKVYCKGM